MPLIITVFSNADEMNQAINAYVALAGGYDTSQAVEGRGRYLDASSGSYGYPKLADLTPPFDPLATPPKVFRIPLLSAVYKIASQLGSHRLVGYASVISDLSESYDFQKDNSIFVIEGSIDVVDTDGTTVLQTLAVGDSALVSSTDLKSLKGTGRFVFVPFQAVAQPNPFSI